MYYPWLVAVNLEERYDTVYASSGPFRTAKIVQGICMDGWHIPRYEEARKMASKIYYRFRNYSKAFGDDDIVGIHLEERNLLTVERDSVTGAKTVSKVTKSDTDWIWLVEERDDSMYGNPIFAYVTEFKKNSVKKTDVRKYEARLVRCVKDYK